MSTLAYRNIGKSFPGGARPLSGLDLEVSDGEFLVLVGASGCGKSTALRLLAGLEEASEGEILIDGRVVNHLGPQARNIAMVFQSYALYPHMTVAANLSFPLEMARIGSAERTKRVAEVADMLDLGPLLQRKPGQLSGGQRQRVAMGRALVRRPCCFLMDEPLSNLDAKLRVEMRSEIMGLQRRTGTTTVYVTHDQVEAMTMGHRVAVMRGGKLQQVAPPQELYRAPVNLYVAAFIGSPSMNLLRARCSDDGQELLAGPARIPVPAHLRAALAAHRGKEIALGLRPESLRPDAAGPLTITVDDVEGLGHEQIVHGTLAGAQAIDPEADTTTGTLTAAGEARLAVRLPALPEIARGSQLRLTPEPATIHAFAPDGKALR